MKSNENKTKNKNKGKTVGKGRLLIDWNFFSDH